MKSVNQKSYSTIMLWFFSWEILKPTSCASLVLKFHSWHHKINTLRKFSSFLQEIIRFLSFFLDTILDEETFRRLQGWDLRGRRSLQTCLTSFHQVKSSVFHQSSLFLYFFQNSLFSRLIKMTRLFVSIRTDLEMTFFFSHATTI